VFRVLNLEYYPRESNVVTFRDPWSFPILYHPACSNLVRQHMADLAQKVGEEIKCWTGIMLIRRIDCGCMRLPR